MQEYSIISRLTFSAAVLTSGLLTARALIPPNRISAGRAWGKDYLKASNATSSVLRNVVLVSGLAVYYAALAVSPPAVVAALCPAEGTGQRNPSLFAWNAVTGLSLLFILAGALLRRMAYSHLGRNFTFGLAKPHGLVTSGIYKYMQHPSYTGLALIGAAYYLVFFRFDGAVACFVSSRYWPLVQGWSAVVYAVTGLWLTILLGVRVVQEETMLKELFGKEWEEWHAKTKRFIPGII
ncbi:hypothetical protein LMH87_012297 [Akanthomyces muscarius]|uniref:Protein-S-isoprenylcysteine O-methyltransferase n=2 Tax=Akanthomyces TaxID=150366 RepID=A0A168J9L7_CORDF|nr:hypothetical protein LMH87_012297 [Akanthomyces muscarius]KAJ4151607.1 hypothetical protein LMH87_012297 [Akanthomyces muscarius]OAA80164.1 Isoprenylcysteine carboxyl methyltransferase [Akanthomyces lecanii RCEF 1005]